MLDLLGDEVALSAPGSKGKRQSAVAGFIKNTERAAGGLPLRAMPNFLRPLMGWLMPRVGPRGLEFARARIEMKAAETVLHLRRQHPARMRNMIPAHIWRVMERYGVLRRNGE
jgi:coenzyme F420 hydrogenase subunit beta